MALVKWVHRNILILIYFQRVNSYANAVWGNAFIIFTPFLKTKKVQEAELILSSWKTYLSHIFLIMVADKLKQ